MIKSLIQRTAKKLGYEIHRLPNSSDLEYELFDKSAEYRRSNGELLTPELVHTLIQTNPIWAHTIPLPFGIKTPGTLTCEEAQKHTALGIPKNLHGFTVLDVGCWDGYYSFLCEKRGATVTAIDSLMHRLGSRGFDIAKDILNSKVEFHQLDVYNVETLNQRFDIVLYFGVYYHLKDPLLVFEKLHKITRLALLVEGHFVEALGKPLMFFYPYGAYGGEVTMYWGANEECLKDMIRVAGFNQTITVAKTITGKHYGKPIGRIIIEAKV